MTPTNRHGDHTALDRHHAQHGHADHDGLYNEDVAHEYSDVNVRSLLLFCFGMIATVAIVAVLMRYTFVLFESQAAQNDPVVSPLAVPPGQEPPEPRLLKNEPANLRLVKDEERHVLEGYGWIDEKSGAARIPIDEAKKRLLHDGLPTRATPVDAWTGTNAPARGESSGGRLIPGLKSAASTEQPQPAAAPQEHKPAEKPAEHKGGH